MPTTCSYCRESIGEGATICPHCSSAQKGLRWVGDWSGRIVTTSTLISILVSAWFFIATEIKSCATKTFFVDAAQGYLRIEFFEEAQEEYRRALELKPFDRDAALGEKKAQILQMMETYSRPTRLSAMRLARQLSAKHPDDADLFAILGRLETLLQEEGWIERALKHSDEALQRVPSHPLARLVRGIAFMKTAGKQEEAIKVLKDLVRDQPDYAGAYFFLAQIYDYDFKDHNLAIENYRRAVTLAPKLVGPKTELGRLLVHTGIKEAKSQKTISARQNAKVAEGLVFLRQAVLIDPWRPYPHLFLGRALRKIGDLTEAIRELDIAKCLIEEGRYIYSEDTARRVAIIEGEIKDIRKSRPSLKFVPVRQGKCIQGD